MFLEQGAGPPGSGLREAVPFLGGALGHFIFSLIGLKRILFTDIFQKLSKPHLVLPVRSFCLDRIWGSVASGSEL